MSEFKIGRRSVGGNHPAFIVAEVGINHQGDVNLAKQLIEIAALAGADAVKFQKRTIERMLAKEGLNMPYEHGNSFGPTYGLHRQALELSDDAYRELKLYAEKKGPIFFASAWDEESADFLESLEVPAFKIPSADLTNLPLLAHIARKKKPVLLSTGMSSLKEVETAYSVIRQHNAEIAIMQCTSTYPTDFSDVHLRVLKTYQERFPDCVVGYSGHELGIAIPVAAVAFGAKIIERHFTIDRTMKGGDHAASLEPIGLQKLVRDIRNTEMAFGTGVKEIRPGELSIKRKLAKSIVSTQNIKKGDILRREMLTTKAPGTGIPPFRLQEVIGKRVMRDIPEDSVITEDTIEWT